MLKNYKKLNFKTGAVIQARMGATRMPGKVMLGIEGEPMIWHVIDRIKKAKKINEIILAIPDTKENDILEKFAKHNNTKYFRGSEKDVLYRYYCAAKEFKIDTILRITSDCPLVDPELVDLLIEKHLNSGADYVSNVQKRTFPKGLDIEVFTFDALEKAHKEGKKNSNREHVTLYIREHPGIFRCVNIENNKDLSRMRWTVDETKDLEFVREIYKRLYKREKIFLMDDVLNILKENPQLLKINGGIKRKKI